MEVLGGLLFLLFMMCWGFYKMVKMALAPSPLTKVVGRAVFFRLFR